MLVLKPRQGDLVSGFLTNYTGPGFSPVKVACAGSGIRTWVYLFLGPPFNLLPDVAQISLDSDLSWKSQRTWPCWPASCGVQRGTAEACALWMRRPLMFAGHLSSKPFLGPWIWSNQSISQLGTLRWRGGRRGPGPGRPAPGPECTLLQVPRRVLAPRPQGSLVGVRLLTTRKDDMWLVSPDRQPSDLFRDPCCFSLWVLWVLCPGPPASGPPVRTGSHLWASHPGWSPWRRLQSPRTRGPGGPGALSTPGWDELEAKGESSLVPPRASWGRPVGHFWGPRVCQASVVSPEASPQPYDMDTTPHFMNEGTGAQGREGTCPLRSGWDSHPVSTSVPASRRVVSPWVRCPLPHRALG